MIRTQIYLTEQEVKKLKTTSAQTGKKQSALIRQAIDNFLASISPSNKLSRLRQAKGIWEDRSDEFHGELRKQLHHRSP